MLQKENNSQTKIRVQISFLSIDIKQNVLQKYTSFVQYILKKVIQMQSKKLFLRLFSQSQIFSITRTTFSTHLADSVINYNAGINLFLLLLQTMWRQQRDNNFGKGSSFCQT